MANDKYLTNQLLKLVTECESVLNQLDTHSQQSKELHEEMKRLKAMKSVHDEAILNGCINPSLLYDAIALNLDDFSIDTDFNSLAKEAVRRAKFDADTSILFAYGDSKTTSPSKAKGKNPFSKTHFNLTEQGLLIKSNPELAKKLKEEAE